MDLSGIIFVVLAVAWAGYLIPKALRHQDEVSRTRSVEQSSASARVLARREAGRRDSRPVATRQRTPRPSTPAVEKRHEAAPSPARARARQARPAGSAARRRRRLLGVLVLAVAGTGAAAHLGYAPWWTLGVPAAVTLAFLVLCLGAGRRRRLTARAAAARARSVAARTPARAPARVVAPEHDDPVVFDGQAVGPLSQPAQATDEQVDVPLADPEPQVVAAAVGGTLWDPLPITLPTYITKPTARRTVRTIDLSEPRTWTSGRTAEDAEIAARAADARIPQQRSEEAGQRVANS